MAYEELCMYCFEDRQGQVICPHCGRDSRAAVPQIQMLPGTLVYRDRFIVGRALGQDATGIVYSAFDTKREAKLKLREYLPRDCAERLNDGSVVPVAGLEDQFEKGMRRLRASVEGVEDPKKRHFFFEENGTAYIAQRKSADTGAAPARERYRDDEDDERRAGRRQLGLMIGGAAAVVIIAVVVIISMVNGALRNADDVIQNPTLAPSSSNALWAPAETPTPTPYVAPTFAALVDPDQSWMDYTYAGDVNQEFDDQVGQSNPTPKPTIRPETTQNPTVNNQSGYAEIIFLQQRLAALGWLPSDRINGDYDSATKQAVKDFQTYVNTHLNPSKKLDVDGIAGPITQQWLYGTDSERPTPAPTPVVTPDPNQGLTVDKNSPKNDIKAVQRKLIVLGLMKKGSDDGVYGNTTTAAVKKFQQRVNQLQGYEALKVTGVMDPTSIAYLNYYVDWWENLQQATATPEPVLPTTPEPTEAPTPEPTDIPDKEENGVVVDQNSPKESIAFVQEMLIGVGLLPNGSNDGVYSPATADAVEAFQKWVNSQLGDGTVPVTGIADEITLGYLEYAYSEGMSARPTDAPTKKPTAEPTEVPTPEPTEIPDQEEDAFYVNPDSPKESIQLLQQMMIDAGLLPAGSDDGVYGNGTAAALVRFQKLVNEVFGKGTVPENGIADAATLNYLEEFIAGGMTMPPEETATPKPTDVPTAVPTEVPTPVPTEAPQQNVISPDSPKESIQHVQRLLIEAGLLGHGDDDGVYGNGTAAAILEFQQFVNDSFGDAVVPEDGIADAVTMGYLEEFVSRGMTMPSKPTEAPTEVPTEAPTEAPQQNNEITPDSPAESVVYLQRMMIAAGLLEPASDDGNYGKGTASALKKFQKYVNDIFGEDTVPENGIADAATLGYLNQFVSQGLTMPADPTQAPTEVPTEAPTEAPQQNNAVTPDSPKEYVVKLQQMMIEAGLLPAGSDDGAYGKGTASALTRFQKYVNEIFGKGTVPENGIADQATLGYLNEFISQGLTMPPEATEAPKPTEAPVQSNDITPDSSKESIQYMQSLLIQAGLLGKGANDGDYGKGTASAVLAFQQYVNDSFGDAVLPEDGIAGSETMGYLEEFVSRGMTVPAKPTEAPKATEAPVEAQVSMKIEGTEKINGVHALTGDRIGFSWKSNVPCEYYIYVTDANGNSFYSDEATDSTKGVFSADMLTPGVIYTIQIGALPVDGGESDMAWTSAQFGIPAPKATEKPKPAAGVIEKLKLAVNGDSPDGIVEVTGDSVSFKWSASGDLAYYSVVVQSNSGDRLVDLANTQETKGTLPASKLTPGEVYTISVVAVPTNDGEPVRTEARFGIPARSEPTEAPKDNSVEPPVISIDGPAYSEDGVQHLTGDSAIFAWNASGDIQGFMLYILNSADERLDLEPTTDTSMTVPLDNLPADTYRFFVGAVPQNAKSEADVVWSSLTFAVGSAD